MNKLTQKQIYLTGFKAGYEKAILNIKFEISQNRPCANEQPVYSACYDDLDGIVERVSKIIQQF